MTDSTRAFKPDKDCTLCRLTTQSAARGKCPELRVMPTCGARYPSTGIGGCCVRRQRPTAPPRPRPASRVTSRHKRSHDPQGKDAREEITRDRLALSSGMADDPNTLAAADMVTVAARLVSVSEACVSNVAGYGPGPDGLSSPILCSPRLPACHCGPTRREFPTGIWFLREQK
jgi:hypothetical protein